MINAEMLWTAATSQHLMSFVAGDWSQWIAGAENCYQVIVGIIWFCLNGGRHFTSPKMGHVFVFSKPDHSDFLGIILGKISKAVSWCIVASRVGSPKTVQVSMEEEVQAGSKDERSNEVMIIIVMIVVPEPPAIAWECPLEPLPRPSKTGSLHGICPPSFAAVATPLGPSGQETRPVRLWKLGLVGVDLLDDGVRECWPGVSLFCLFLERIDSHCVCL